MDLDPLAIVKDEVDLMDTVMKYETNEFEPARNVGLDVRTEVDPLFLPFKEEFQKFPDIFAAPLDNLAPVQKQPTVKNTDIIVSLMNRPFLTRTFTEKQKIVSNGRPRPALPDLSAIHKSRVKSFVRKFHTPMYDRIKWLTGSATLSKLFCWPCLLFSVEHNTWNKQGFENLNSLSSSLTRHEQSLAHLRSFFILTTFNQSGMEPQIGDQQIVRVFHHNEMVKRNISVLKRLIDTVCLLAKQELPFNTREETNDSFNKGNYVEELNFLATYDLLLRSYLETGTDFRATSHLVQNDLIESISRVLLNEIKQELRDCKFVAILLDEITDFGNLSQMSTVLRYVKKDGKAVERFVGYTDMSADNTADALFGHVVKIVKEYGLEEKLIAQSYDGAVVMPGDLEGLCARVMEQFPGAKFVHCLSHRLDLVLQDVCRNVKQCRLFFSTLSGLDAFFSKSPQRRQALNDFVHVKSPRMCPTECNFNSNLVNTIWCHLSQLIEFFEHIINGTVPGDWDRDTIIMAQGYLTFLTNYDNCFLLNAFSKLFVHIDVLHNVLQTQAYDIDLGYQKFRDTETLLKVKETTFNELWDEVERVRRDNLIEEAPRKRKRTDDADSPKDFARRRYLEIISTVISQLNSRFATMKRLKFIRLLDPSLFHAHRTKFPDNMLMSLENMYPHIFNIARLKNELFIMYGAELFKNKHPHQLVPFMQSIGLNEGMTEIYRLACLFLTIPSSTASNERSFSARRRIKSNIRATMGQEKSSSLSLLSIEKELLTKMKLQDSFYDQVMSEFLEKSRRVEFEFK